MEKSVSTKLKPCPFCGGEAQFGICEVLGSTGYTVKCSKCFCKTDFVFVKTYIFFMGKNNVSISKEKAKQIVAVNWNKRVYHSL